MGKSVNAVPGPLANCRPGQGVSHYRLNRVSLHSFERKGGCPCRVWGHAAEYLITVPDSCLWGPQRESWSPRQCTPVPHPGRRANFKAWLLGS